MSGDGQHENTGAQSHLRSQQSGGGAKAGGHPLSLNEAFGRNAEAMNALMHGTGVEFTKNDIEMTKTAGQSLAQLLHGDKTGANSSDSSSGSSSTSTQGRGGGADAVKPQTTNPNQSRFAEDYAFQAAHRKDDKKGRGL